MPDVRMPDGTVVKNVPDGITRSELLRKLGARSSAPKGSLENPASIGPPPTEADFSDEAFQRSLHEEASAIEQETPWINRPDSGAKAAPVLLGGTASLLVPGAGWGALALQSLAGGAGAAGGEFAREKVMREPVDPARIAKEGAATAAGNQIGGTIIRGLGIAANKIFSSPLSDPAKAAAEFAKQEGAKFPLSSAVPGSAAARTQQASRMLLPGDIKTQVDANRVAQFLNTRIGTMTEKAQVFDDAARQGQQFLREVFEPGETAIKNTFAKYSEAVGEAAPIPSTNTLAAAKQAAELLEKRGQTTGGLYQRLRTILKKNPATYTARELDELYGSVIKQAFNSRASAGGEGRILLEGITRDLDDFGKVSGVSFADDIAKAAAVREQFRELRKIPQLERLATDIADRGGAKGTIDWMNSLFSSGNGKALAKFRELNPQLYHDLADAWLARQIDSATKPSAIGIGRQLDGAKLRTWFEQNQAKIKEIFGAPQAKVLDNFSNYAAHMTGAIERAAKSESTFSPLNLMPRLGAEGFAVVKNPVLMIPGEPAAFVLARGLSDPNSTLFRLFTEGFSPTTRSFMRRSGQLAGQTVAREQNTR